LVIVHHVGQGYGPTGGFWLFVSSRPEKLEWMGRFFSVNASFFMSLFFMISGYFFAPSFDKKGFKNFTIDKLIRYGVPLVFAYWIMMPLIFYFNYEIYSNNPSISYPVFFKYIFLGSGIQPEWFKPIFGWPESELGFGHLWFVENLLVFALIYAVMRTLFKKSFENKYNLNSYLFAVLFVVVVSALTIMVRRNYPVGEWKDLFGFITSEVGHLPQYTCFLIAGIIAWQTNLFARFPAAFGNVLLILGLLMASSIYLSPWLPKAINSLPGKSFEIFETIMGFSLSFGLIVLFREKLNLSKKWTRMLSGNAYGAYIFHFPIVIAVQVLLDKINLDILLKFLLASIISIIVSFAFTEIIRKSEIVRKVI